MNVTFALGWENLGSGPLIKGVGVVCGALIAGYFSGLLTHLLFKGLTMKKAPGPAVHVGRAVGFVGVGAFLLLLLFGVGGSGLGGLGGLGFGGPGEGPGEPVNKEKDTEDKDKDDGPKPPDRPEPGDESTLRVEVLGSNALKKIAGESFDPRKRYRIREEERRELLTLEALQKVIAQRQKTQGDAFRRVHIILYRDSPEQQTQMVDDLRKYAENLPINDQEKMRVSFEVDKNNDAPVGG